MHCHWMIAKTAKAIAESLYEDLASDNMWYKGAKETGVTQKVFVSQVWPQLIEEARHNLAKSLNGNLPQQAKDAIADALIKDNLLREGRLKATYRVH